MPWVHLNHYRTAYHCHMHGLFVSLTINTNCLYAHLAGTSDHPACYLASVCYENLVYRLHLCNTSSLS